MTESDYKEDDTIMVIGAGPAGLSAAITLAKSGKKVIVHEAKKEVGHRFKQDFQGLENWTTDDDVLLKLSESGIDTLFNYKPCRNVTAFDAWDNAYVIKDKKPLFYLVERGPNSGSLDNALLEQAISLGVDVRFNSRIKNFKGKGILATGPKSADAIAVGYHFKTNMEDGCWVICDNNLAPKGYAYLLIWNGQGTVKTCMFSGFKKEQLYVKRTVEAFERLVNLKMINPVAHGGVGNFHLPTRAYGGNRPIAGEQAGFQDTLWGFGMRQAITSGMLAAKSLQEDSNYDELWSEAIGKQIKTSIVNRLLFNQLGNYGFRWFLRKQSQHAETRKYLQNLYIKSPFRQLISPLARLIIKSTRKDKSCNHIDCECVWCKHGNH
ncbi:MAG: NAD(P)/FAD-dependent oxidoreductase [Gammaproteobacteria bacterium]|nr:NAD(P)/FAD-dependent oxidoreductase [Gammaproteobacteria bacterium]